MPRADQGAEQEVRQPRLPRNAEDLNGRVRMLETAIMRPALNESNLIEFEFYRLKAMSATMLSEQARKIPPRPIKT